MKYLFRKNLSSSTRTRFATTYWSGNCECEPSLLYEFTIFFLPLTIDYCGKIVALSRLRKKKDEEEEEYDYNK